MEHQIRGRRAVCAEGLQGKGFDTRSVRFTDTSMAWYSRRDIMSDVCVTRYIAEYMSTFCNDTLQHDVLYYSVAHVMYIGVL